MLICSLISLVLLVADQRGHLVSLHAGLSSVVYPLQAVINWPAQIMHEAGDWLASRQQLQMQNQMLRERQMAMQVRLLTFSSLEQENIRLRGLLQTSARVGERFQIAELLAVNVAPHSHVVVINKGSRDNVYVGQPVFDAQGVVGQVVRVAYPTAEVMLISDPGHGIPVQVNRNGVRTIALGTGRTDRLVMPYLSGGADIQEGDLLVTSGMGGIFPQGYPVGTVTSISSQGGPFAKISAVPAAALDRVREVLLVWRDPSAPVYIPEKNDAAP